MKKIILSCMIILCSLFIVNVDNTYCEEQLGDSAEELQNTSGETSKTDVYDYVDSQGNKGKFYVSGGSVLIGVREADRGTGLSEFVIPDYITTLGLPQVVDGIDISKVYIPGSVESLGYDNQSLLMNNTGEFIVDEDNKNYCSIDGVVYTKDKKIMCGYPSCSKKNIYKVPDSVVRMQYDWTTRYPENLQYIIFPKSLQTLELFCSVDGLKSFYLTTYNAEMRETLEKICTGAFSSAMSNWQNPRIVYLPENTKLDFTIDTSKWLPIIGDDYKLSHALFALKTSLGIYDMQLDLREYYEGKEDVLLFDENKNGKVDLSDATGVLKKSLGIVSDTDKSDEEVSTPTPAPDMELTPAPKETNSPIVFPELSLTPPTTSPEVTPAPRPELIDTTNPEDVEYDEEVVKNIDFVEVYKAVLPTYQPNRTGTLVLDANGLLFTTIDEKKEIMEYMKNGDDRDVEIASSWDEISAQQIAGYKCEGFDYPGWTIDGYWYSIDVKSVSKDEIVLEFDRTAGAYNGQGKELVLNKVDGKWTVVREEEVWIS